MAFDQSNIAEAGTVCNIILLASDTNRDLPRSAYLGVVTP
jgi:hypothetical protein